MPATPALPDELLQQVQEYACAENKQPAELLEEAERKFLKDRSWMKSVENKERRARAMGITEDDIPRLIAEVRSENKRRGRD